MLGKFKVFPLMIFVSMILLGGFVFTASADDETFDNVVETVESALPTPPKTSWTSEYRETESNINKLYDTNKKLKDNGQIYSQYDMPDNDASDLYVNSYLNRLVNFKNELKKVADSNPRDDSSALDTVHEINENVKSLDKDFAAGADFTEIEVVLDSGEKIVDSGINGNKPQGMSKKLLKSESIARNTYAEGDSYDDEAEELADAFNVKIIYGLNNVSDSCLNSYKNEFKTVVALVCSTDTSKVYVNTNHDSGDLTVVPGFLDYIKHEISHSLISQRCGTLEPGIAKGLNEAVTSSYAVKYLGADYIVLQSSGDNFPDYKMTDESDAIAQQIHDEGKCVA